MSSYTVYMMVKGKWRKMDHSTSFSDTWDYARTVLRRQNKTAKIKIVGPEGEWEVK